MKLDRSAIAALALGLAFGYLLVAALTALAQFAPRFPIPVEQLRLYADVYGAVKMGYVDPVDDRKAVEDSIRGMVAGLDERSQFYDAAAFRELQVGSFPAGGIGLELGMEEGLAKVVTAIEGTPAARAGLRSGDLLLRVDDQPVRGRTLAEVVKLLRGNPGTEVRLTVVRSGERAPLEMLLRRELIRINPVRAALLPGGLGYVRVSSLQESVPARLAAELARLFREQPGLEGVILDLRNNPGGLLNAAVGSSALFLPEGAAIGTTEGRVEDSRRRYAAVAKDFLRGGERDFRSGLPAQVASVPLAVIVNRGSASGTEILAAALQDDRRAVIVGEKTYGLGSIQTILPLSENRGLKLTTAYWLRPGGGRLEKTGVVPDVAVEGASAAPPEVPDPAKDPVLARAMAALKR